MVRFDAYTATTQALTYHQAFALIDRLPGDEEAEGQGYHSFGHRLSLKDHAGDQVAAVLYGGKQGERIMLEVKGERTPQVVERLRSSAEHRATRVDSCRDWDRPGIFAELLEHVLAVKSAHGLYGSKAGDWEDHPQLGRTQYLGAATSVNKARLYEKGKQAEHQHLERPDWVRLELQVRPAKDAKSAYSRLSPVEVWGASRWTRDLAGRVLELAVDAHPSGNVRKDSSAEQALRWMAKQYGPRLLTLHDDLGGWKEVGLTLGEMVREEADRAARWKKAIR